MHTSGIPKLFIHIVISEQVIKFLVMYSNIRKRDAFQTGREMANCTKNSHIKSEVMSKNAEIALWLGCS